MSGSCAASPAELDGPCCSSSAGHTARTDASGYKAKAVTMQLAAASSAQPPKGMRKGNRRRRVVESLQYSEDFNTSQDVQGSATSAPKQGPSIDPSAQHDMVYPKTLGCTNGTTMS